MQASPQEVIFPPAVAILPPVRTITSSALQQLYRYPIIWWHTLMLERKWNTACSHFSWR